MGTSNAVPLVYKESPLIIFNYLFINHVPSEKSFDMGIEGPPARKNIKD